MRIEDTSSSLRIEGLEGRGWQFTNLLNGSTYFIALANVRLFLQAMDAACEVAR